MGPAELLRPPAPRLRTILRGLVPSFIFGALCPFAAYQVMTASGVSSRNALVITAIFPLGWSLTGWLRRRSLDAVSLVSLLVIALGVAISLVSGDARFYLVKDSLLSGAFGAVWLLSLLFPRPLMFYVARQLSTGGDPVAVSAWSGFWSYRGFRDDMRRVTAVWGLGLLAQASVRTVIALTASPSVVLAAGPILDISAVVLLIAWTLRHGRAVRREDHARAASR